MIPTKQDLVLIRGIPGTGKSTLAERIKERFPDHAHFEADMFFVSDSGRYRYDAKQISRAHRWCQLKTEVALKEGKSPVIVSNTLTQNWQMVPYFHLAREYKARVKIVELFMEYGSTHGVPEEAMQNFRDKWESVNEANLFGLEYSIISET